MSNIFSFLVFLLLITKISFAMEKSTIKPSYKENNWWHQDYDKFQTNIEMAYSMKDKVTFNTLTENATIMYIFPVEQYLKIAIVLNCEPAFRNIIKRQIDYGNSDIANELNNIKGYVNTKPFKNATKKSERPIILKWFSQAVIDLEKEIKQSNPKDAQSRFTIVRGENDRVIEIRLTKEIRNQIYELKKIIATTDITSKDKIDKNRQNFELILEKISAIDNGIQSEELRSLLKMAIVFERTEIVKLLLDNRVYVEGIRNEFDEFIRPIIKKNNFELLEVILNRLGAESTIFEMLLKCLQIAIDICDSEAFESIYNTYKEELREEQRLLLAANLTKYASDTLWVETACNRLFGNKQNPNHKISFNEYLDNITDLVNKRRKSLKNTGDIIDILQQIAGKNDMVNSHLLEESKTDIINDADNSDNNGGLEKKLQDILGALLAKGITVTDVVNDNFVLSFLKNEHGDLVNSILTSLKKDKILVSKQGDLGKELLVDIPLGIKEKKKEKITILTKTIEYIKTYLDRKDKKPKPAVSSSDNNEESLPVNHTHYKPNPRKKGPKVPPSAISGFENNNNKKNLANNSDNHPKQAGKNKKNNNNPKSSRNNNNKNTNTVNSTSINQKNVEEKNNKDNKFYPYYLSNDKINPTNYPSQFIVNDYNDENITIKNVATTKTKLDYSLSNLLGTYMSALLNSNNNINILSHGILAIDFYKILNEENSEHLFFILNDLININNRTIIRNNKPNESFQIKYDNYPYSSSEERLEQIKALLALIKKNKEEILTNQNAISGVLFILGEHFARIFDNGNMALINTVINDMELVIDIKCLRNAIKHPEDKEILTEHATFIIPNELANDPVKLAEKANDLFNRLLISQE
jgi:hypothetical protein